MQINPRAYPHPVLAHWGDDIMNSTFQGVVTGKGAKNAYLFEAVFKTNNDDLLALVEQNKAMYAVHLECTSTRYRNLFKSLEEKFSFEINAGLIDGRVDVCSFILAAKPIDKYKNANFHPDYGKAAFRASWSYNQEKRSLVSHTSAIPSGGTFRQQCTALGMIQRR